jgi:acetyl-CoA C-acetyltransferase
MANRCAVIGIGQTKHMDKRRDVNHVGLTREACRRALEDARLSWKDVDALVIGKAPDTIEGVMLPELYMAEALGMAGKPLFRVHTAGSVGGATAIVGTELVGAGLHDKVLVLGWEKQSESDITWALSPQLPFHPPLMAGAGGFFAPHIREYIRRSGAPDHIGIKVVVKDRRQALRNPYAHLHQQTVCFEEIRDTPMLWDPIRFGETCPSSDGACAMVLSSEKFADHGSARPAWIHATEMRSEPTIMPGRDEVNPRAGRDCAAALYKKAGITNPRKAFDCAEIYVAFSWFEPMLAETLGFADPGEGWKLSDSGATSLEEGGDIPWNCSGGVLSSNPIGASGTLRFAEAALQVRGQAGEHQVDGARLSLAHALGGASQFFAMWIVGSEKP